MKKVLVTILGLVLLAGCVPAVQNQIVAGDLYASASPETITDSSSELTVSTADVHAELARLPITSETKQGEIVTVIGQKANSGLVGDSIIWLNADDLSDGTAITYDCQMADAFLDVAESSKPLTMFKIKGTYVGKSEFNGEFSAITFTLMDCEII
jgi:hypothetical protein